MLEDDDNPKFYPFEQKIKQFWWKCADEQLTCPNDRQKKQGLLKVNQDLKMSAVTTFITYFFLSASRQKTRIECWMYWEYFLHWF